MISRDEATNKQVTAATPTVSTWLAANAGSGKTRVLTDRVARLLLQGVRPERILCLTYTKAAASEMQNRLFSRLGDWAMMSDERLGTQLAQLGESATEPDLLKSARTLFAQAIETPGGLKIQTIHSFCSSLLRRFPLEAGVSPQFTEIEDRAANILRREIVEDIASGPHRHTVSTLAQYLTDTDFEAITAGICSKREGFAQDIDIATIGAKFGLPAGYDHDALAADVFLGDEQDLIAGFRNALVTGGKSDAKAAEKLRDIGTPVSSDLPVLEGVFLTGATAKSPFTAKIGKLATKAVVTAHPDLMERLNTFALRIEAARQRRLALDAVDKSLALHDFAQVFLPEYTRRKELSGALDFDDLIFHARNLLSDSAVAQWVLYRLDGGIDHILVDEAQDTSPAQWDVVDKLAQEFTAGEGARGEIPRTIFVVGDKKQSIYSFQGADPDGFDRMQDEFGDRLTAVGQKLQRLSLDFSFRSSAAILQAVDLVFGMLDSAGFRADGKHIAFKNKLPGRVDVWPVVEPIQNDETGHWTDPVDRPGESHHSVVLAERIAGQIKHMMANDTLPNDDGTRRAICAGDIMILVQRRSDLFEEIIRACKSANLPIAGADRLKVGAELAVKDLASLLRFLDTAEDDLSLAEALKSPLLGWDEQMLFDLAHRRPLGKKSFLWEALRNRKDEFPDTMAVLDDLRRNADYLRPFDLIERILIRHDGRRKLLSRLGAEAEDGVNALLSQALSYEHSEIPSLTGFNVWLESDELEIKRQMSGSEDLIRVMTVHGSKGLEAPIVFLPDTAARTSRAETGVVTDAENTPFWTVSQNDRPANLTAIHETLRQKRDEENQRLLYVAMTRAETWLIVAAAGKMSKDGDSWYQQIHTALEQGDAEVVLMPGGEGLRLSHEDWTSGEMAQPATENGDIAAFPDELLEPLPRIEPSRAIVRPSALGGAKALSGGHLDEEAAMLRGTAVHRLLEYLPTVERDRWAQSVPVLLRDYDPSLHASVFAEAENVLTNNELEYLFSPDTLAEVSVTATIGDANMSGQIDRLVVSDKTVLAVDFKSNAVVPDTPSQTPEGILRQMGAYAQALAQIYPDRTIQTAILWTAQATLMPLDSAEIANALARGIQETQH